MNGDVRTHEGHRAMRRMLAIACLALLWSAPTMYFRSGSRSPDTFRGEYDTASAIPAAIAAFALLCCTIEVVRRLSKHGRVLPPGYLRAGAAPHLTFYVLWLGATLAYTPSLILGAYMYARYVVALLVGLLFLTLPEYPIRKNLTDILKVLGFYYVVYLGYQLFHFSVVNANDVCKLSSDGMIRCHGAGPFQPEFGTAGVFFIFVVVAGWVAGRKLKWWHLAILAACLVWVVACRTRAVMFALLFVLVGAMYLKQRNVWRALIALVALVVAAIAVDLYFPEQAGQARSFLLREGEGSLETLSNRQAKWEAILPYWWENAPIVGLGYSGDRFFFANPRMFGAGVDSHNEFVFMLVTGGVILVCIFVVVFAKVFLVAFSDVRLALVSREDPRQVVILFMLLVYFYVQMPTSSQISHYNLYFNMLESIVLNGLLASHYVLQGAAGAARVEVGVGARAIVSKSA